MKNCQHTYISQMHCQVPKLGEKQSYFVDVVRDTGRNGKRERNGLRQEPFTLCFWSLLALKSL